MVKKSKLSGWPELLSPTVTGFVPAPEAASAAQRVLASSMEGGLDLMKSFWGGLPKSTPGFVLPTVDLAELDQRLKDLRAVESWLELNANMLKATIQGLEVQRQTVAALKSFGANQHDFLNLFAGQPAQPEAAQPTWPPQRDRPPAASESEAVQSAAPTAPTAPSAPDTALQSSATAWMQFMQDQFQRVAGAALATRPASAPVRPKKSPSPPGERASKTTPAHASGPSATPPRRKKAGAKTAKKSATAAKKAGRRRAAAHRVLSSDG